MFEVSAASTLELCGLLLLTFLLVAICLRLEAVRGLLLPEVAHAHLLPVPATCREGLVLCGAAFFVLSKDKVKRGELQQAKPLLPLLQLKPRRLRLGRVFASSLSAWRVRGNYVFNRGFGLPFSCV